MSILKVVKSLILYLISFYSFGQNEIKKYVQANVSAISFINPDSIDYSDLEVIGSAIGGARIVMMGEQDHNDGPGYFAKIRLIKYLHEKKGFNVVAFEADFINMNNDWKQISEGRITIDSFVQRNIVSSWKGCQNASPFFTGYLTSDIKTTHPIEITGIDSYTNIARAISLLDSALRHLKIPITQTSDYANEVLPLLRTWYNHTGDTVVIDKIIGLYEQIKREVLERISKNDFWLMVVDNLITMAKQYRTWKKGIWQGFVDRNIRDKQMALNLKWLSEVRYPDQKIIVWAHNYHISKYAGHYPQPFLNKAQMMGSVFTADSIVMNETYIIGFTSFQGTAGRLSGKSYKVQKPKAESFENWIDKAYSYAFVDFKKFNNSNPAYGHYFYMKCSVMSPFHRNEMADWTKIFDGVFYIKDTYRCLEE